MATGRIIRPRTQEGWDLYRPNFIPKDCVAINRANNLTNNLIALYLPGHGKELVSGEKFTYTETNKASHDPIFGHSLKIESSAHSVPRNLYNVINGLSEITIIAIAKFNPSRISEQAIISIGGDTIETNTGVSMRVYPQYNKVRGSLRVSGGNFTWDQSASLHLTSPSSMSFYSITYRSGEGVKFYSGLSGKAAYRGVNTSFSGSIDLPSNANTKLFGSPYGFVEALGTFPLIAIFNRSLSKEEILNLDKNITQLLKPANDTPFLYSIPTAPQPQTKKRLVNRPRTQYGWDRALGLHSKSEQESRLDNLHPILSRQSVIVGFANKSYPEIVLSNSSVPDKVLSATGNAYFDGHSLHAPDNTSYFETDYTVGDYPFFSGGPPTAISVIAWIPKDADKFQIFCGVSNDTNKYIGLNSRNFQIRNSSNLVGTNWPLAGVDADVPGRFFVGVQRGSNRCEFWVDGRLVALDTSSLGTADWSYQSNRLSINRYGDSSPVIQDRTKLLSFAVIKNYSLTATEIKALYEAGPSLMQPSNEPVFAYSIPNGSPTISNLATSTIGATSVTLSYNITYL